jgi:hypothetical protein
MKLKYEAAKHSRYKNGGLGYKKYKRAFIGCQPGYDNVLGYWWVRLENKPGQWVPSELLWGEDGRIVETFEGSKVKGASSDAGVRSVKAFRRRLKQWRGYLPKGTKFTLISRLIGCDVYGKI